MQERESHGTRVSLDKHKAGVSTINTHSHPTVGVFNYNARAKLQQREPWDLRAPKPIFAKPSPAGWYFLLQPRTRPFLRDYTRDLHPGWADGRQTARRTRRLTRVVGEGGGTILSRAGRAGGADVSQPRRAARRLGIGGGAGLGPGCPRGGGGGAGARAPVHPGPPPAGP